MDHISLSDPMTWVMVLVVSVLFAGLRVLMRGRAARPETPPSDEKPKT